jgi:Zn-dependent peptidase ImmA (M78 family)
MPKVYARINPRILEWARSSAGMDNATAAGRLKITGGRLGHIESGDEPITFPMLKKAASIYKRPVAAFYLPDVPASPQPIPDFRKFAQPTDNPLSTQAIQQIRLCSEKQRNAVELATETDFDWTFIGSMNITDETPEDAGINIRRFLGIEQQKWANEYEAFNYWRTAVESKGILTFQIVRVSPDELSGFSLASPQYPAIALNRKDSVRRRIFTLLHEMCHICLGMSGLCDISEVRNYRNTVQRGRIEVFCNRFAASALVPKNLLSSFGVFREHDNPDYWRDYELTELANVFMVSHEMMILRLIELGKATEEFLTVWREEHPHRNTRRTGSPREKSFQKALRMQGKNYVSLVLNAMQNNKITTVRACEYLDIKAKHLSDLERSAGL